MKMNIKAVLLYEHVSTEENFIISLGKLNFAIIKKEKLKPHNIFFYFINFNVFMW